VTWNVNVVGSQHLLPPRTSSSPRVRRWRTRGDLVQHQLRGDLPQALVHAALVEAAHLLSTDTEESSHAKEL